MKRINVMVAAALAALCIGSQAFGAQKLDLFDRLVKLGKISATAAAGIGTGWYIYKKLTNPDRFKYQVQFLVNYARNEARKEIATNNLGNNFRGGCLIFGSIIALEKIISMTILSKEELREKNKYNKMLNFLYFLGMLGYMHYKDNSRMKAAQTLERPMQEMTEEYNLDAEARSDILAVMGAMTCGVSAGAATAFVTGL